MSNLDIRVIATDGNLVKEVLYINHQGTSIIYNYRDTFGSGTDHLTYHEDGYVHRKWESPDGSPNTRPIVQGPPLNDFKGFYGAQTFQIAKRPDSKFSWGHSNPNFDFSQKDAIVYIDVRNAERFINVHPYFIEAGKPFTDVLDHPGSQIDDPNLQYQVITETDPWTVIGHYAIDKFEGYLQPHSRDFVVIDEDRKPHPIDKHGQEKIQEYRED